MLEDLQYLLSFFEMTQAKAIKFHYELLILVEK